MTPFEFFSLLIQFGMLVIAFLTYLNMSVKSLTSR
ncbi:putative holin-like toxin [Veillonella sp. oral taxon 780]